MLVKQIPINQIIIPDDRLRNVNPAKVDHIAHSIKHLGLLSPITVTRTDKLKFTLVAGLHRIMALDIINADNPKNYTAPAIILPDDLTEQQIRLAEVDENLCRNELDALERAKFVSEQKDLWDKIHGETRGGDRGNQHTGGKSCQKSQDESFATFSQETAELLGISPQSVNRARTIAKSLAPFWSQLEKSPFRDNQAELLKLSKCPTDKIPAVIKLVNQAYESDDKNSKRLRAVQMAIKAICKPDTIKPSLAWGENEIAKLQRAFDKAPKELLVDWFLNNFDRLSEIATDAKAKQDYENWKNE